MNFKELQKIIADLQTKMSCPQCKEHYSNENISIIGSTKNECTLTMDCQKCLGGILINIVLDRELLVMPGHITFTKSQKSISSNDVLDMHNFLKYFNGDFFSYLKKK